MNSTNKSNMVLSTIILISGYATASLILAAIYFLYGSIPEYIEIGGIGENIIAAVFNWSAIFALLSIFPNH